MQVHVSGAQQLAKSIKSTQPVLQWCFSENSNWLVA